MALLENAGLRAGQKQVVIVGGGFAGLAAAKRLEARSDVHVALIDQRNHHLFQPLLYQVATAGLNPADIAVPIRSQFPGSNNISVHLGQVDAVDLRANTIAGGGHSFRYDYLIVACGAQHSYFGHADWEEFAPGLKTLEQATEIRRRILLAFELAENEFDPVVQRSLMTFVVVGGGATGVELAGAIADISRTVLVKDFRRINPATARVVLVEAGPRLLAAFSDDLAARAAKDLKKLGVEVLCDCRVESIDADGVRVAGRDRITAKTVLWGAGVQAAAISKSLGTELDRAGRIKVLPDLTVPGYPNVFAVGDLAHLDLGGGLLLPGVAPAAIQTGKHAAANILRAVRGEPLKPFKYRDKGQMATIGKRKAIAQTGQLKLTGYLAWLAWLFVHILYLVGFRNRVAVFFEWSWSYLFSKRGARLITSRSWRG